MKHSSVLHRIAFLIAAAVVVPACGKSHGGGGGGVVSPSFSVIVSTAALGNIIEGANATFDVELSEPPTADVTIPITVTTGVGDATVSSPGAAPGGEQTTITLTLNATNMSRTVQVTATQDANVEATEPFVVTVGDPASTDTNYDALTDADTADVSGSIVDDDTVSIIVTPVTAAMPTGPTLLTSEAGQTDTFQVRLGAAIVNEVTVNLTINVPGADEGSASSTAIVFDNTNAQTFQTVTITGLADSTADLDVEYTITLEAENTGLDPADDVYDSTITASVVVINVNLDGLWTGPPWPPGVGGYAVGPTATPGIPLGGVGVFNEFETDHPTVLKNGSTYEMWFRGRSKLGVKADAIGRGTSTNTPPSDGWTIDANSVLDGNDTIPWIRRGVGRPSVQFADFNNNNSGTPDSYTMFFSGRFAGEYDGIDWVTSTNGTSWNPDPPVSTPRFQATGVVGEWDEIDVNDPCVIFDGTTFHMWYTGVDANGLAQIGYAFATAQLSGEPGGWTRANVGTTPALAAGAAGQFDAGGVSAPAVVKDGSTYRMWFTANDPVRGRTTIGYAESDDPADFSGAISGGKFPVPVIVPDSTGTALWSDQNVFAPAVILDGTTFRIWYSGTGTGGAGIGYLEPNP